MSRLTQTKDESYTLYSEKFEEHYHSQHGARAESQYVFITQGLNYFTTNKKLSILELGFGTGLNTLLTILNNTNTKINYTTIEAYPLTQDDHQNFEITLPKAEQAIYQKIYSSPWDSPYQLTKNVTLIKKKCLFQTMNLNESFDLIYMDAFSPRKQPECWTDSLFKTLFNHLNPKGILVTYCAKGSVKRSLANIGFKVITLPGPPGKREMIRAIK